MSSYLNFKLSCLTTQLAPYHAIILQRGEEFTTVYSSFLLCILFYLLTAFSAPLRGPGRKGEWILEVNVTVTASDLVSKCNLLYVLPSLTPLKGNVLWMHAQSCLTLCDPMNCNLPGSSVHGIFQLRILEWVFISLSRGSSQLRDWPVSLCFLHWQANSLPLAPSGKPNVLYSKLFKTIFVPGFMHWRPRKSLFWINSPLQADPQVYSLSRQFHTL